MLSRLHGDAGSAVSDFVLLVVPASLLVIPLIELFGLYQSSIVKEQVSYDIARYAALADVSVQEAEIYKQTKDSTSSLKLEASTLSCAFVSSSEIQRRITFWPTRITVPIQGRAQCESN